MIHFDLVAHPEGGPVAPIETQRYSKRFFRVVLKFRSQGVVFVSSLLEPAVSQRITLRTRTRWVDAYKTESSTRAYARTDEGEGRMYGVRGSGRVLGVV